MNMQIEVRSKSATELAVYLSHGFQHILLLRTTDNQNKLNSISNFDKSHWENCLFGIENGSIFLMSKERPALTSTQSLKELVSGKYLTKL